jgi:hypothetical protein
MRKVDQRWSIFLLLAILATFLIDIGLEFFVWKSGCCICQILKQHKYAFAWMFGVGLVRNKRWAFFLKLFALIVGLSIVLIPFFSCPPHPEQCKNVTTTARNTTPPPLQTPNINLEKPKWVELLFELLPSLFSAISIIIEVYVSEHWLHLSKTNVPTLLARLPATG